MGTEQSLRNRRDTVGEAEEPTHSMPGPPFSYEPASRLADSESWARHPGRRGVPGSRAASRCPDVGAFAAGRGESVLDSPKIGVDFTFFITHSIIRSLLLTHDDDGHRISSRMPSLTRALTVAQPEQPSLMCSSRH